MKNNTGENNRGDGYSGYLNSGYRGDGYSGNHTNSPDKIRDVQQPADIIEVNGVKYKRV